MEDPVVRPERNLYAHLLAGLLREKAIRESSIGTPLGYVDDFKLAGKKNNLDPMWKTLMRDLDFGEPTSFFDHVYLGCTQRECETSKDIAKLQKYV